MPCEETSSEIRVTIDNEERLASYEYEKMTCGKGIGIGDLYSDYVRGKIIDDLSELDFESVLGACPVKDEEEEFLLYLEWKAVREALREYLGKERGSDRERYRAAEIMADKDRVIIHMIINPPDNMPEIVPCGEKNPIC